MKVMEKLRYSGCEMEQDRAKVPVMVCTFVTMIVAVTILDSCPVAFIVSTYVVAPPSKFNTDCKGGYKYTRERKKRIERQ